MQRILLLLVAFLLQLGMVNAQTATVTFTNPLLSHGADPFSFYKDGYYYYMHTAGSRLVLHKTKSIADLATAEKKVIFDPPPGKPWSKELWAPEIHFLKDRWYVYFAADDGDNINHRMFVLENKSADPMTGEWVFKGKVADRTDKWAIDGSVFEHGRKLYMVWSGWQGDHNGQQDIYIARLKNPVKIKGKRVRISSPVYEWEKDGDLPGDPHHVNVNEGPQPLENKGRLFLVYSASGCWTDSYSLGLLTFTGRGSLLDSASWRKSERPVFTQSREHGVYAPGHNSFFKSPDGTEDWILYHANSQPGQGCGRQRSPRAQKFSWKEDGTPEFDIPVKEGTPLPVPSYRELMSERLK